MSPQIESLLQGAFDIHIHCGPDVVPRAQDALTLVQDARRAGMAGILLKDHTTSTVGRADALNRTFSDGPHVFSALALNPPVGGLNPFAVEAALREGVDVVYMPTYAARGQIATRGADAFPAAYPRPDGGYPGLTVLDGAGALKPEVTRILDLIAEYDAVLATGHLSRREISLLLAAAPERGVQRTIVTHASGGVPGLPVAEQRQAVKFGAFVEHCLLALVEGYAHPRPPEELNDQIRQVGVEHCILSSDLGQAANGPIVAGFARCLDRLRRAGLSDDEIRTMIVDNPRKLLGDRRQASQLG